jgi:hypothetical protein
MVTRGGCVQGAGLLTLGLSCQLRLEGEISFRKAFIGLPSVRTDSWAPQHVDFAVGPSFESRIVEEQ